MKNIYLGICVVGVVLIAAQDTQHNGTNEDITSPCKTLKLTLDSDYGIRMKIGTPGKNIKLMPGFHTHRTFVTSTSCLRCK